MLSLGAVPCNLGDNLLRPGDRRGEEGKAELMDLETKVHAVTASLETELIMESLPEPFKKKLNGSEK